MENIFEHCINSKEQGFVGEARAIYEYTKLGYVVCKPFKDCDYDLIIEKNGKMERVQIKTTTQIPKEKYFVCNLRVLGGNQSFNTAKNRNPNSYDMLFVLAQNNECWSIPTNTFNALTTLTLDKRFESYKIK
jgi:hypothetical protein